MSTTVNPKCDQRVCSRVSWSAGWVSWAPKSDTYTCLSWHYRDEIVHMVQTSKKGSLNYKHNVWKDHFWAGSVTGTPDTKFRSRLSPVEGWSFLVFYQDLFTLLDWAIVLKTSKVKIYVNRVPLRDSHSLHSPAPLWVKNGNHDFHDSRFRM